MLFTFPSRYWFTIGLSRVFSLAGWSRPIQAGFHVSRLTQDFTMLHDMCMYGVITLFDRLFQSVPFFCHGPMSCSYYPKSAETPLVWALPRSLAATGGITVCFLFLQVIRCFSSLRLPSLRNGISSIYRVDPFGHLRIKGYLHLPAAFRSLSRPSSPVRAKASTVRSSSLLFNHIFSF